MSDVQIVIDTQSCVEHNVSPAEFEQKIKAAITELGFTVGIEMRATHSNILAIHPLGCSELAFSHARDDLPKHEIYQIIMDIFHQMKQ
ncbi:MAG: hypothetical protein H7Z73_07010 [Candidatus Saccharibacteria bacterium]|nr:hypothetical protein [Moraxellaceae bacterium]